MEKHNLCIFLSLPLASLGVFVLLAAPAGSQNKRPIFPSIGKPGEIPQLNDPKYWAEQRKEADALTNIQWVNEQWTGDDAPYAAVRLQIERAVDNGERPSALVEQYANQAKSDPNDPLAQFAWACAASRAVKLAPPSKAMSDLRFAAELALAEAPQPHTYNYDRLRYLIWIQGAGGLSSYYLRNLGDRLLKRNPQDFSVQMAQCIIYTQNPSLAIQQHGYNLIQQMIKKYPTKPEAYDMLGCWYGTQYLCYHSPTDYQQATVNYQKALDRYPTNSARRADLPNVIAYLTTRYHQIDGT